MEQRNRLSVQWLNGMVTHSPAELVTLSERMYNRQIDRTADEIAAKRGERSILLVSGPSASTKTTTAMKLADRLARRSVRAVVISLDDFFINRRDLPLLPNGDKDFESIRTMDLDTLNRCFREVLRDGWSDFPIYDFPSGCRSAETRRISIDQDTIVIMEGIHALNPEIVREQNPGSFFKLYISPNSDYYEEDELILSARDVRLIRRIVRDFFHRGNTAENTMRMWVNVVASEKVNILPYKTEADFIIDSTILYEPNIYEYWLDRILDRSTAGEAHAGKLAELSRALSRFVELKNEFVPADTVLHEFLE